MLANQNASVLLILQHRAQDGEQMQRLRNGIEMDWTLEGSCLLRAGDERIYLHYLRVRYNNYYTTIIRRISRGTFSEDPVVPMLMYHCALSYEEYSNPR